MLPDGMAEELVCALTCIFGARLRSVVLYGSAARREQTPESDIDIALFLREPMTKAEREQMISRLVELDWKYDRELSVSDIEQSRFEEWADYLPYYRFGKTESPRRFRRSFGKIREGRSRPPFPDFHFQRISSHQKKDLKSAKRA